MIPPFLCLVLAFSQPAAAPEPARPEAVMLDDYGPCGLTSLYLVCQIRHVPVEWTRLQELVGPVAADGSHSFADLARAATALGMHPVGLEVNRVKLHELPMPAILQVQDPRRPQASSHLLVLLRPEPDGVYLLDPPYPAYFLPESRFASAWTGRVLVFAQDAAEAGQIRMAARANQALPPLLWAGVVGGVVLGLTLTRRRWAPAGRTWLAALRPRFRGRLVLGLLTLSCIMAGGLAAGYYSRMGREPRTAPRCEFDKAVADLGELSPGVTNYTVTLTNGGREPLRIAKVHSTCACALVKAPDVIEPGQSSTMEVELNVSPGPQAARLTIESNDPEGPKTVVLSWHGKANPRLVPGVINDSAAPADRPYERVVRLVYPGGRSAQVPRLERCECESPRVEVRPGKNDPLAVRFARSGLLTQILGEQELHVTVQAPDEPGPFTSKCTLHLKYGEAAATLVLPIFLSFVGGDLKPEVNAVVFSAASPEGLKGQERLVRLAKGDPAGDLVVQDVPPWLGCEVLRKAPGDALIRLTVVQSPPEPLAQHTLHIRDPRGSSSPTVLRVSAFAPRRE